MSTSWKTWPAAAKLKLLGRARAERWALNCHPGQAPPDGDWRTWYARGGRGSGKTRTGAEVFGSWVLEDSDDPGEWAIVAPTYGDARDTCVEGGSGLLAVLGPTVETWNRSLGEMRLHNGVRVHIDGADDGALRIQGKNLKGAWLDEIGLFKNWQKAWEESISFAVRIDPAQIIATGTPKGNHGLVKLLVDDEDTVMTHLRLEDNEANLSAAMIRSLRRRYEGTRLGRQELHGEILDDVEGALWTWKMIDNARAPEPKPDYIHRLVVAVDPAITATEDADETGIVVACIAEDRFGYGHDAYVLDDFSGRYTPGDWAQRAVGTLQARHGDRIVAERNQGGDMVEATIRTVDPHVPVTLVWASRGKRTRAEPVAALYEQGRVHHCGDFPELESEMTTWTEGEDSPSRLDALVWALTDLMIDGPHQEPQVESMPAGASMTADIMQRREW